MGGGGRGQVKNTASNKSLWWNHNNKKWNNVNSFHACCCLRHATSQLLEVEQSKKRLYIGMSVLIYKNNSSGGRTYKTVVGCLAEEHIWAGLCRIVTFIVPSIECLLTAPWWRGFFLPIQYVAYHRFTFRKK